MVGSSGCTQNYFGLYGWWYGDVQNFDLWIREEFI
jgi:hypothetical protein